MALLFAGPAAHVSILVLVLVLVLALIRRRMVTPPGAQVVGAATQIGNKVMAQLHASATDGTWCRC